MHFNIQSNWSFYCIFTKTLSGKTKQIRFKHLLILFHNAENIATASLFIIKKTTNKHINIYKWNFIKSCFKTFTVVYRGVFNRVSACQNSLYPQPKFWQEHVSPLFAEHASGCQPIFSGSTITRQCIVKSFFVKKKIMCW